MSLRPVMRFSTLRTMKGMNGGGPDMTSQATEIPARLAQESPTSEGMTRLLPPVESGVRVNYVDTEMPHPVSSGAADWGRPWWGRSGVWTLSTLWVSDWVGLVPDWAGFRMFQRESSVCKGWNPVRVPPRAQCFRRSAVFLVFFRVHFVHTLASDLMFRVCGVPERPLCGCVGERLATAGRVPSRGASYVFSYSVVLPLAFRIHHFMVARAAHNMIC